jgi:hypothetical protein
MGLIISLFYILNYLVMKKQKVNITEGVIMEWEDDTYQVCIPTYWSEKRLDETIYDKEGNLPITADLYFKDTKWGIVWLL